MEPLEWILQQVAATDTAGHEPTREVGDHERVVAVLPPRLRQFYVFYRQFRRETERSLRRLQRRMLRCRGAGKRYQRMRDRFEDGDARLALVYVTFWGLVRAAFPHTVYYPLRVRTDWQLVADEDDYIDAQPLRP